jgi:hypothetical protein
VVGPTKRKPRRFSSFAIAFDSGVLAGTSWPVVGGPTPLRSGAKAHRSASRVSARSCRAVGLRVRDRAGVADDSGVGEEPLAIALSEGGDSPDVPIREGASEPLAPTQNREPRESRLERLEDEHLERLAVAVHGSAQTLSW